MEAVETFHKLELNNSKIWKYKQISKGRNQKIFLSKGKFDIHEFVAGHEFVPIGYEFVSTGYEFVPTEFLFLHISEIFFCRKFDIL